MNPELFFMKLTLATGAIVSFYHMGIIHGKSDGAFDEYGAFALWFFLGMACLIASYMGG